VARIDVIALGIDPWQFAHYAGQIADRLQIVGFCGLDQAQGRGGVSTERKVNARLWTSAG